jgi:hypothetical protein
MPGQTADFWYLATIFFHAGAVELESAAAEADSFIIFMFNFPRGLAHERQCQQLHATHLVAKAYTSSAEAQAVPQKFGRFFI